MEELEEINEEEEAKKEEKRMTKIQKEIAVLQEQVDTLAKTKMAKEYELKKSRTERESKAQQLVDAEVGWD